MNAGRPLRVLCIDDSPDDAELNVLALVAPSLVKRGAPLLVLLLLALFWRLRRGRTR